AAPPSLPAFPTRRSSDLLEEVEGILPGARVYAKNISGDGLQSGKQLPLGPALLGRVLDGSGKPLDGLPSPDTTETGALITQPFKDRKSTRLNSSHVKISY